MTCRYQAKTLKEKLQTRINMDDKPSHNLSRRDFLKLSALTLASVSIPGLDNCSTLPKSNMPEIDYSHTIRLINCNAVDVINGNVIKNAAITVKTGKIINIQNCGTAERQDNIDTFDLNNRYVIPGLIDAHCHSTLVGTMIFNISDMMAYKTQAEINLTNFVNAGITTIRDAGGMPGMLKSYIGKIANETISGPRIKHCNAILNINGGHPDINLNSYKAIAAIASSLFGLPAVSFKNMDEMQARIPENAKGASFIKLTVDDTSLMWCKGKIPVYTDEMLSEIFNYSEKNGLPVMCHNLSRFGFERMMDYPVHSMEHIASNSPVTDESIMKMAGRKAAIVPTLVVSTYSLENPPSDPIQEKEKTEFIEQEKRIVKEYLDTVADKYFDPGLHKINMKNRSLYKIYSCAGIRKRNIYLFNPHYCYGILTNGIDNLTRMKEAGVLIGCGTDAGVAFNYAGTLWREMELYSRIGFSNNEILRCATINNAKILRMEDQIGSIEEGKFADLAVLDKNPIEDITACRKPGLVFIDGKLKFSGLKFNRTKHTVKFS